MFSLMPGVCTHILGIKAKSLCLRDLASERKGEKKVFNSTQVSTLVVSQRWVKGWGIDVDAGGGGRDLRARWIHRPCVRQAVSKVNFREWSRV